MDTVIRGDNNLHGCVLHHRQDVELMTGDEVFAYRLDTPKFPCHQCPDTEYVLLRENAYPWIRYCMRHALGKLTAAWRAR